MAILLFCTAACSDSYLELSPESSVSDEVIFENADAAQYAVNGLGRIMSTQYLDTQGYNGEGTVYAYQGEYPGDVIQKGSYTGWQNLAKGNYFTSSTNSNIHVTWYYYYKLIRNANQILDNCKTGLANVAEQRKWDYIKAQALVYRAYSYTMLSQLYSRRWTDADGLQRGLVLRTTVNNDEMPCSTMAETFELIYHDLDEAISLFTSCGYDRPVDVDKRWMANLDVAHAVYSRAALIRNDWQTVITHSQEARRNYSIMTPDEYKAGFNTANQEWIWEVFEDDTQPVHYYSFYNYMSASCLGSASRTYPPCISKQIVDPIDPADKRLAIYAIPTPEEVGDVSKVSGSGKVTKGDFYNRVKKEFAGRIYSTTTIFYYLSTKFIVKSGSGAIALIERLACLLLLLDQLGAFLFIKATLLADNLDAVLKGGGHQHGNMVGIIAQQIIGLLADLLDITFWIGDIFSLKPDFSLCWCLQKIQAAQEGRFSRTGWTDYNHLFSFVDGLADSFKNMGIFVKTFTQIFSGDHLLPVSFQTFQAVWSGLKR